MAVEGGEGGFGVAGAGLGVAVLVVFDGLDQALQWRVGEASVRPPGGENERDGLVDLGQSPLRIFPPAGPGWLASGRGS